MNKEAHPPKEELQSLLRTPQEIVSHLDQYIIGQDEAKKTEAAPKIRPLSG